MDIPNQLSVAEPEPLGAANVRAAPEPEQTFFVGRSRNVHLITDLDCWAVAGRG